jgi:hypothetical protein
MRALGNGSQPLTGGFFVRLFWKRGAIGPGVLNDPFFSGGLSMGDPKIAIVAYCLAVGFILVVAFQPSKTMTAASVPAVTPVANLK